MKEIPEEYKDKVCCVCGRQAVQSMQFIGGERSYPKIYYCDKHGEYNDEEITGIGFSRRSFRTQHE